MAVDTKPNFSSSKFEQCSTDIMNLSGCTQIYGLFDIESGATLTICGNAGTGKVLTSDATGVAGWETPAAQGITAISGGSGMNFSPITSTGSIVLGTPSSITSGSTNSVGATTHNHCFNGQSFVSGTQGILVDGNNRFYLDETYITDATLPNLYSYSGITANQSIGALPSGQTLGMVYITNTGSSIGYFSLGTTPTGDDITPYQTIQVDPAEDVSITVNMRLSLTENKTIYVSSADWTDVGINLQWANITYQNASTTINPGDLPIASPTTLGAIKVGSGLDIDGEGILSVTGGTGGGTVTGATNLGTGNGQIYSGLTVKDLDFKTLSGGTSISLTTNDNYIGINFTGATGGSASGENVTKEVTQATHGFAVKDFIGWSGGTYNKAIANGLYDGEFVGLITEVPDGNTFKVTQSGYVSGLTGLVTNTTYFLSETTAGLLTSTAPTGDTQINKAVLIANSTTSGWVLPYAGYVVTTGTTGGGSGGFLGVVTKDSAVPSNLAANQWVKPEPMTTNCFNYTFDNFLDSGTTAISVNLSLEDVYLRYDGDNSAWIKESYERPLSSGYTWIGSSTCKVCEIPVINEWVDSSTLLCYTGQKYAYPTQNLYVVDIDTCATTANKIFIQNICMKTVANTCIFSIPAGMTAMISSAKVIMLNDASPTSMSVSIGNNSCGTPSLSYQNMINTTQIDDVLTREVYDITPTQSGAVICNGGCCGADVYFRVQSGSTSGNNLCAHLLVEGFLF